MGLTGKCIGCTTCCEYLQFVLPGGEMVSEWGRARGFEVVQENEGFIEFRIHCPCPHLKDGKCDIHDHKPEVCRLYPEGMPDYWKAKGFDPNKSLGERCGFGYSD